MSSQESRIATQSVVSVESSSLFLHDIFRDVFVSLRKHAHATYSDFSRCKNDNFQLKYFVYFHIFAQNIDCEYSEAVLTSIHNLCFGAKI